jgi:hypothetical protein
LSYRSLQRSFVGDYEAFAEELSCLSEAKDDVIAEYDAAVEFVDEFEDVLFERA